MPYEHSKSEKRIIQAHAGKTSRSLRAKIRVDFSRLVLYNISVDEMFGGVLSAETEYLINTQIHAF